MTHKAATRILDGTVTASDAQTTRDTAITTALSDFDTAYDALDPDDPDFETDVAALIVTRNTALSLAISTYDDTFLSDVVSEICGENPDRLGFWVLNDSNNKFYLIVDSDAIAAYEAAILALQATRDTALALALSTYDTAAAALDPEDVNYATDLAALRTTRDTAYNGANTTYDTAQAAADNTIDDLPFTYVSGNGGRYELPGQRSYDGPIYGLFAAANGTVNTNEVTQR